MAIESKMYRPPAFGHQNNSEAAKTKPWVIIIVVLVLAGLAAGAWWYFKMRSPNGDNPLGDLQDDAATNDVQVQSGAYQAVFLDNGQVYFGELGSRRDGFYRLSSVYYMKYRSNPQAGDAAASDVELVKLGSEVHAPDDFMDINETHVLFIEDLRSDSKVAKAIAENIAKTP